MNVNRGRTLCKCVLMVVNYRLSIFACEGVDNRQIKHSDVKRLRSLSLSLFFHVPQHASIMGFITEPLASLATELALMQVMCLIITELKFTFKTKCVSCSFALMRTRQRCQHLSMCQSYEWVVQVLCYLEVRAILQNALSHSTPLPFQQPDQFLRMHYMYTKVYLCFAYGLKYFSITFLS